MNMPDNPLGSARSKNIDVCPHNLRGLVAKKAITLSREGSEKRCADVSRGQSFDPFHFVCRYISMEAFSTHFKLRGRCVQNVAEAWKLNSSFRASIRQPWLLAVPLSSSQIEYLPL